MNVSPRTIAELVGTTVLTGLLVWQFLTAAALRTERAELRSDLKGRDLVIQAKDLSLTSCNAAVDNLGAATRALSQATSQAQDQVTEALQAAQDRSPAALQTIDRLLRIRPTEGQDCQIATDLARAAWEEGQ